VNGASVDDIAKVLRSGEPCGILIGGTACRERPLIAASRIASSTNAKLLCETFPARIERGAGLPAVDRIAYLAEFASMQLDGLKHLILVDAKAPVSFFAYPDKASYLVPDGCEVHTLSDPSEDAASALDALAEAVGADPSPVLAPSDVPERPTGALTAQTVCAALGALLPDNAIVSDEGNTAGLYAAGATAGASRHDWLCLTGGAIGQGLPVALGAAVAGQGRKVVALQADGSAMYTLQSWWTMAREGLDVTTVLLNNSSYAVLNMELSRVGAEAGGPKAREMLDLSNPNLDFTSLAKGMGLEAWRCDTAEGFTDTLERALATDGPTVVEAMIPGRL
jgi:acetolactate synthase-1/2/3 large subunit